jgi:hypothetical protein
MANKTTLTLKKPSPAEIAAVASAEPLRPKPSPAESRRDRVAINVFQALVTRFAASDPTRAKLLAKDAFDYADAFLAEREKRGAHE